MVTETATEPQAAAPSTEEQGPITPTTGNAAAQPADAAAGKQDEAETSVQAFLGKSKEGAEGGKEAAKGEGEAEEVDPIIKQAQDAAAKATAERVEREERTRIQQEEAQRQADEKARAQKAAFDKHYDERMANAGANLEQRVGDIIDALRAGQITPEGAKQLVKQIADANANDFNSHHADGLKLHEDRATAGADQRLTGRINDTLHEVLGSDAPKFFGTEAEPKSHTLKGHYEALKEIWTAGLISKADAEADAALKLVKYHRELQQSGRLKGASSTSSTNGSAAGSGYRTKAEARNLHARNEISNAEMRRINADPSIPEM